MNKLNNTYDDFFDSYYSYYFFTLNDLNVKTIISPYVYGSDFVTMNDVMAYVQISEKAKKNKLVLNSIKEIIKKWYPNVYSKIITL